MELKVLLPVRFIGKTSEGEREREIEWVRYKVGRQCSCIIFVFPDSKSGTT